LRGVKEVASDTSNYLHKEKKSTGPSREGRRLGILYSRRALAKEKKIPAKKDHSWLQSRSTSWEEKIRVNSKRSFCGDGLVKRKWDG